MNNRQEQIEQARRLIATGISEDLVAVLHQQFPELAESEDERIRKFIIECIDELQAAYTEDAEFNGNCSLALAYLEKQKDYELSEADMSDIPKELKIICDDLINHRTPITLDANGARRLKAWLKEMRRQPHKTREEWEKQKEQKSSAEEILIRAGLKPFKDGNQWCILLGDNIQEGICGL